MNFTKIEYPRCPECLVLINDISIFSLQDLRSNYFHLKHCPKCEKPFLMSVNVTLTSETVPVSDY